MATKTMEDDFQSVERSKDGDQEVQNGTQDWKHKPASKNTTGGNRAALFVLAELVGDRLAFDGVSASLVTYLTTEMGQATASASVKVNQWTGTTFLTSVLGGFVADAYLGRFATIAVFSTIFLIAMILLTLLVSVEGMKPCQRGGEECSRLHVGLFYLAIYGAAVASGASKPCASAFGGDQYDEKGEEKDKSRKASFFNWWFFVQSGSNVIAVTLLVALQSDVGWGWGYGVPTTLLAILLILFVSGAPLYRYFDKAAVVVTKGDKEDGGENKLGVSRWRLCSVTEVEEVKLIVRTLPIWLSLIPFSIATAQTHSLFIKQASTLDRSLGSIQIPAASVAFFETITMVLFLPLYDRLFVPFARKYTGHHRGITLLQRMGIGILLGVVGMASAAIVEKKRLHVADGRSQKFALEMSIFWLLPQYAIIGLAASFTSIGRLEFFYDQVPNSLKSLGTAMYLSSVGVGNFLSSALITIINRSTHPPWIGPNLNTSHVDYFYWLLACLVFLEFWVFVGLSIWYRYKPNPSPQIRPLSPKSHETCEK